MRKNSLITITKFAWMLLISLAIVATACKKDDDPPTPPVVILDGTYIVGTGTALADFDAKGLMKTTRNEVTQEDRTGLLQTYIAVKGGADGFNIIKVEGSTHTIYGPAGDFAEVAQGTNDEPKVPFWRGGFEETGTKFTVAADGLYHIAIDMETMKVVIVPVDYWGLIGAATPGGWGDDTQIPKGAFDLNTMTFEVTDVVLTKGDFKFRYSGGWKVELDTTVDVGNGNIGVKVNSNYGGTVDALVPGGDNIANDVPGYYTAKMVWFLGAGYTATLTKTGDLETFDYSATELGLVGDGLMVGGEQHNWEETIMLSTPTIEGETNYTWIYTGVEVTTLGSFKIREGQDWTGKSIGYPDVVMAGTAADKFDTNGDGNFVPLEDGVFDIELLIDAVTETYTFTVKEGGSVDPELYMLGDATAAGWDNTAAIPMNGTGGVYTLTADLLGAGEIKFITELGAWQPQYGTDDTGTSAGGPLFVNDGTGSDPAGIPGPDAGTYVISVNTIDMTYTIVAAK